MLFRNFYKKQKQTRLKKDVGLYPIRVVYLVQIAEDINGNPYPNV